MVESRDLMTRLKEDTRGLHDAAEGAEFMGLLMSGRLSRARFVASVQQTEALHRHLEPILAQVRAASPRAGAVLKDYHFGMVAAAQADLKFLGAPTVEPGPGVQELLAEARRLAASNPEAVLGIFYVLEGSLNGAKILSKKYQELFKLEGTDGILHLDPHGREMRPRWMEFVQGMNTLDFPEATKQAIVEAAGNTFRYVGMMYRGICTSTP